MKQGGIATQMADAAAEEIAAQLGADIWPEPFRPVLRGLLLTGAQPHYLRHELTGVGQVDAASPEPLWWPPAKIVGRYLAPFLAGFAGLESPPEPRRRQADPDRRRGRPPRARSALSPLWFEPEESESDTVGEVMSADPLVVAPEDTLGELAEKMRDRDTGSAAVAQYGR